MGQGPDISNFLGGSPDAIARIRLGAGPNRQVGGVVLGLMVATVLIVPALVLGDLDWLVPWALGVPTALIAAYFVLAYAFAFRHPLAASLDSVDYARVLTKDVGMMPLPDGGSPLIELQPIENPKLAAPDDA
jgi:hypothetical protein